MTTNARPLIRFVGPLKNANEDIDGEIRSIQVLGNLESLHATAA